MRSITKNLAFMIAFAGLVGMSSNAFAQSPLGNALDKHWNWDDPAGWKTGNSGGWTEGETVPHLVTMQVDSSAQVNGWFLDICLQHLVSAVYGYNGLAPYTTTLDPAIDDNGVAIVVDDVLGPVSAENAVLWSLTDEGFNGAGCDNTGEWAWQLIFSVPDSSQITRLYYGGVLAKPGDVALNGGNVDNTNSPSNKPGVWQSRVESGGDRTTQIVSPGAFLPVELVNFTARMDENAAVLEWETATETNNAGFAVEHSSDGVNFAQVGFVEGHGTTIDRQAYSFEVNGLGAGTHKFRLRQIDFDGAFDYSPIVELATEIPGTHELSSAYPNPFNPTTNFSLAVSVKQEVSIALYDALGRQVQSIFSGVLDANVSRVFSVRASDLPSGTYIYVVKGENFRDSRSVILLK